MAQHPSYIAKIFYADRLEILAANNLETLGTIVGQALSVDFPSAPIRVEFSIQKAVAA